MNIGGGIGFKLFAALGVPIQIEFTVDDFKYLRINTGNLAGRGQAPRSISAILWCVTLRFSDKQIPVRCTGKIPFGIIPLVGVLPFTFYCAAFGMIGDRIIAFDGDAKKCRVYLVEGGYGRWQYNKK